MQLWVMEGGYEKAENGENERRTETKSLALLSGFKTTKIVVGYKWASAITGD